MTASTRWLVVDSASVETVKFARSQSGRHSIAEAEYGYIPSEKRVFFELRLHGLVSDQGIIVGFSLTPANTLERGAAEGVLAEHAAQYILADNGHCGGRMGEAVAWQEHVLWTSSRPSVPPASKHEAQWRRWLRGKRDLIESVFNVLSDQFKLETTRARSLWGMGSRIGAKLLTFNLSIFLTGSSDARTSPLKISISKHQPC